ncbi:MAG TPA: YhcN/YlaJ family sporulation lipoprotein [Bacilli bacterium]|nr:YhcN/YlaJ family sporulation lipoprotein [Bacilli bacterium]
MNRKTATLLLVPALLLSTTLVGCNNAAAPDVRQGVQDKVREGKQTAEGVIEENKTTRAERNPNRSQVSELRKPKYEINAPKIQGQNRAKTKSQGAKSRINNINRVADYIADTVNRIPGVERSAVLLTGKTALVGVDLSKDISGSKIDTIKYSVKEAAENTGTGYNAIVTADVDTVTRVRELIAGAKAGKPIDSVSDEIADIISRLLPEM